MNTPRKRRRFDLSKYMTSSDAAPKAPFVHGLTDPEYAQRLALIVSSFEHVETFMPRLLAVLMGQRSANSAAYIYRSLKNPQIRYEVLLNLLENAPVNRELGDEFDILLSEN